MIHPAAGPCLFDVSAETWLLRGAGAAPAAWLRRYLDCFPMNVAVTSVTDRLRGYAMLLEREGVEVTAVGRCRDAYLESLNAGRVRVLPLTPREAAWAAQLLVLVPFAPTAPHRLGHAAESRPDRLARWRSQLLVAATALGYGLPLVHCNLRDFAPLAALAARFPERFPGGRRLVLVPVRELGVP